MFSEKKYLFLITTYLLFSLAAKGQNLHLKIYGKDTSDSALLDSLNYQKQFTSYTSLSLAVDSLFLHVQKMGFLDAQKTRLKKRNDSLYVSRFSLGKKYPLLKVFYNNFPLNGKTMKELSIEFTSTYFSISILETKKTLSLLSNKIAEQGHPFSSVQLINIQKNKNGVLTAELKIAFTKIRKIDKVILKGYKKFPVAFLKHFIGIKAGQAFSKKRLESKIQRLHNLPFASSIKTPEIQFTKDSTSIYIYLKKEKSNTFDGFLGFSNNQDYNKLQLTGNVNLLLRNNLNYGESLHLQYTNNASNQTKFKTALNLPYLFQTPIGINLELELFKKDSTYISIGQQAKINYQLNSNINAFIGYQRTKSNNLQDTTELVTSTIKDYTANYLTFGGEFLDYNERSNLFPIKAQIKINLGYGTRKNQKIASAQWTLSGELSYIFQLNKRNSIYLHNRSSLLSSDNYLTNELFRFGGINSIRGFAEHSISASIFTATQTEYRYQLSQNLYTHTIVDYGYYKNKLLNIQENLYGFGFGFGLKTAAGILRINFANGKTDDQKFEFSNTKVHLSLTSVF